MVKKHFFESQTMFLILGQYLEMKDKRRKYHLGKYRHTVSPLFKGLTQSEFCIFLEAKDLF